MAKAVGHHCGDTVISSQFPCPRVIFPWNTKWLEQASQRSPCNQGPVGSNLSSLWVPPKHAGNNRFFPHLTKTEGCMPQTHFRRIHFLEVHVLWITDSGPYMEKYPPPKKKRLNLNFEGNVRHKWLVFGWSIRNAKREVCCVLLSIISINCHFPCFLISLRSEKEAAYF